MKTMDANGIAIVSLTVLSVLSWIVMVAVSATEWFENDDAGNCTGQYDTEITPAPFACRIWVVIYTWQGAWLAYAVANIFRRNSKGRVLLNPVVLPILFYAFWNGAVAFNVGSTLTYRHHPLASFFLLLLQTICGHTSIAYQATATADNENEIKKESELDLVLIRVLIQNGIDVWIEWITIDALITLAAVLSYYSNMSVHDASTLSICLLLIVVVGWSVVENTVFFRLFQFYYVWYGLLIWTGAAILAKNYDLSNRNTILTIAMMIAAFVCFVIKIVVYMRRTKNGNRLHYYMAYLLL